MSRPAGGVRVAGRGVPSTRAAGVPFQLAVTVLFATPGNSLSRHNLVTLPLSTELRQSNRTRLRGRGGRLRRSDQTRRRRAINRATLPSNAEDRQLGRLRLAGPDDAIDSSSTTGRRWVSRRLIFGGFIRAGYRSCSTTPPAEGARPATKLDDRAALPAEPTEEAASADLRSAASAAGGERRRRAVAEQALIQPAAEGPKMAYVYVTTEELSRWVDEELTPRLTSLTAQLANISERLQSLTAQFAELPEAGAQPELERIVTDEVGRQVTPLYARLSELDQALSERLDDFAARQRIAEQPGGGFAVTAPSYGPEDPPPEPGGDGQ
jgi:hypothetical protein